MPAASAEQMTGPIVEHGEGPVWHDGWPGLRWVDMIAGGVLELDAASGEVRRFDPGPIISVLRPHADGGVVLAVERGFALADRNFRTVRKLGELWTNPGIRMNDGACDPDGRFYCGSMAYSEKPHTAALYRLAADGAVSAVLSGVTVSNGLAWSPDGGTAYYVDTATRCVDAFDYDTADGLTGRRTVVRVPEDAGAPDGLTVDAGGDIWVALWGGSAVRRYTPEGTLADVIELPTSQVTACTFGGPDLDELYITTSKLDIDPVAQPLAGALFRARPGATGRPAASYDGIPSPEPHRPRATA
jgi:sugar lactone lactonase YvrE